LDEWVKADSQIQEHSFCGNSFIGPRELHDFSSRSVYIVMSSLPHW